MTNNANYALLVSLQTTKSSHNQSMPSPDQTLHLIRRYSSIAQRSTQIRLIAYLRPYLLSGLSSYRPQFSVDPR